MSSKEEKGDIKKKVGSDNEVRKKTSMWLSLKKLSWLNNGICLLLIGSLLTGILVPWFQRRHKAIEWKTNNQFENITFRLTKMRDCLTEFVYLQAFAAEGYELVERFMNTVLLTDELYPEFERDCRDVQKRRFAQNAKVRSLTAHFREADVVKDLVLEHTLNCDRYFEALKRFIRIKYETSNPTSSGKTDLGEKDLDELRNRIKRQTKTLNDSYMAVIAKMKEEIGEVEDESEEFRL